MNELTRRLFGPKPELEATTPPAAAAAPPPTITSLNGGYKTPPPAAAPSRSETEAAHSQLIAGLMIDAQNNRDAGGQW